MTIRGRLSRRLFIFPSLSRLICRVHSEGYTDRIAVSSRLVDSGTHSSRPSGEPRHGCNRCTGNDRRRTTIMKMKIVDGASPSFTVGLFPVRGASFYGIACQSLRSWSPRDTSKIRLINLCDAVSRSSLEIVRLSSRTEHAGRRETYRDRSVLNDSRSQRDDVDRTTLKRNQ